MSKRVKTLLIGLGTFLVVVLAVLVVYYVNKPPTKPSPTPIPTPKPSPAPAQVFEVGESACTLNFTVTGASVPPSATPSTTPSSSPSTTPSSTPEAALDCVVKRVYEDDPQNTAGTYYLNSEIVDTNTLTNGQVVVYNIVVANHGEVAISDTTITDVLSTNLTFKDASGGCSYESGTRTVTCSVGSLPAATEASKSIRVQITTAGTSAINNKAEVFSTNGQRDTCEITVSATGTIEQPPSPVPSALPEAGVMEVTTASLGVGILFLMAGALGLLLL